MKALFGIVSLLVVLALVGMVASKQMKSATQVPAAALGASGTPDGNVRQQSQQLQDKVRDDVNKAMQQGARKEEADQ